MEILKDIAGTPQYEKGFNKPASGWAGWKRLTRDNIWSNHYTTGTGWSTAAPIETEIGRAHV